MRSRLQPLTSLLPLLLWGTVAAAVSLEGKEPARAPVAADLPEVGRVSGVGRTVFVLRGHLSEKRAAQVKRLARAVLRDAHRRFLPSTGSRLAPVDVCLFETTREYQDFLHRVLGPETREGDLGLYWRYRRVVVANLSTPLGNLRHELVHALVGDALGPIPVWLDEGLASLYNAADWKQGAYVFRPSYRLDQLRAARAGKTLPDLRTLATSGAREVYDWNKYRAYYSLGRFLLLYLDSHGKLRGFIQEMTGPLEESKQLKILEKYVDFDAFLAWSEKL